MYLNISTIDKTIDLRLFDLEGVLADQILWVTNINHSMELLPRIEELLVKNNLSKQDIKAVLIARGPGSYTGLRVGITADNLLALALNIPIAGVEKEMPKAMSQKLIDSLVRQKTFAAPVFPLYANEPNITKRKN